MGRPGERARAPWAACCRRLRRSASGWLGSPRRGRPCDPTAHLGRSRARPSSMGLPARRGTSTYLDGSPRGQRNSALPQMQLRAQRQVQCAAGGCAGGSVGSADVRANLTNQMSNDAGEGVYKPVLLFEGHIFARENPHCVQASLASSKNATTPLATAILAALNLTAIKPGQDQIPKSSATLLSRSALYTPLCKSAAERFGTRQRGSAYLEHRRSVKLVMSHGLVMCSRASLEHEIVVPTGYEQSASAVQHTPAAPLTLACDGGMGQQAQALRRSLFPAGCPQRSL